MSLTVEIPTDSNWRPYISFEMINRDQTWLDVLDNWPGDKVFDAARCVWWLAPEPTVNMPPERPPGDID